MTTNTSNYTTNFHVGSVKESNVYVKKQMKDGSFHTYSYQSKKTSVTLQRTRFMQNFIAYNYKKLRLLKGIEITDIITNHYVKIYPDDSEYKYIVQTISRFMKYDAENFSKIIEDRIFDAKNNDNHDESATNNTNNIINILLSNSNQKNQIRVKSVVVSSLNCDNFDMSLIRSNTHKISSNDESELFCSRMVKENEFDFKPMIAYILRSQRLFEKTYMKDMYFKMVMNGYVWLYWFISANINLLFRIIENYAKEQSVVTKKSVPSDSVALLIDNVGIIANICIFLCPFKINKRELVSYNVIQILMILMNNNNDNLCNNISSLEGVSNYKEITSKTARKSRKTDDQ